MYNFEKCPQPSALDISATAVNENNLPGSWRNSRIVIKKKELTRSQTKKLFKLLTKQYKQSKYASEAVRNRALRDLVMLSLALESALRGGDLMSLKIGQLYSSSGNVQREFIVRQQKTKQNVTCQISRKTAKLLKHWKLCCSGDPQSYLFEGCGTNSHFTIRQYSRIIKRWAEMLDLSPENYSTHSMRRTRAIMLYNQLKDLQVVRFVLGHASIQSTQEYLDCDVAKALSIAQRVPVF